MKKLVLKYFLVIFLFCAAPFVALCQELKICEEGLAKCQPLIKEVTKYKTCMRVLCSEFYNQQEFERIKIEEELKKAKQKKPEEVKKDEDTRPLEEVTTCDYGLRKCDSLSSNKEYYWECVNQECKNADNKADASCEEGHFLCEYEKASYQKCLSDYCPLISGMVDKAKECEAGKEPCTYYFKKYWQCVYAICLGPVDNYKKPSKTQKYVMVKDKSGKKQMVIINSNTPEKTVIDKKVDDFFLSKGIDPRELRNSIPQKFRLIGNPADYLYCLSGGMLRCKTNDMRSCQCSDGSSPVNTDGTIDPRYSTE
jgi:hypothetical protein